MNGPAMGGWQEASAMVGAFERISGALRASRLRPHQISTDPRAPSRRTATYMDGRERPRGSEMISANTPV